MARSLTARSSPLSQTAASRRHLVLALKSGIRFGVGDHPVQRPHRSRHAHATHLLASGAHPKVVSERWGHSKVGITLDLYCRVMPGMQENAAARADATLQAAMKSQGMVAKR
jgi:integrase